MKNKILVIEDEKTLRFLITESLKGDGFEIDQAIDGEEGIEKAKQNKPDLILLDLLLPSMNGFDVLSKLKRDSDTESIPVIILSNLGQEEEVERGMKLGATDYMVKAHFTLDQITERIKEILV